jgi:PAS domain S-box-containing protein
MTESRTRGSMDGKGAGSTDGEAPSGDTDESDAGDEADAGVEGEERGKGPSGCVEREWRLCVLCVDDEPSVLEVTASLLERESDRIRAITAGSGAAALERIAVESVDCVVSDYQMPEMDGLALLERVRRDHGDLPFVLFTGRGSEEIASEAIARGVTDYLQKAPGMGTDQFTVLANRVENAVLRRRAQRRADQYIEASPDGMLVVDEGGLIRRMNGAAESLFGYDRAELVGEPVETLVPERSRERHGREREAYTAAPERRIMGAGLSIRARRRDGSEFPVDVALSPVRLGDQLEVVTTVHDATARREREAELAELGRINETLRDTTGAVTRAETREAIQRTVCERLAGAEPYLFAWFGVVGDDREIVPVAAAGAEDGYLDAATITAGGGPMGQGPAGRAVRSDRPQAAQEIRSDPGFAPWREAAIERGYRSVASLPVTYGETRYGLLNVYADRPYAFDERELDVLAELGRTVGHAIHRVELTDTLRLAEEVLRAALTIIPASVLITDDAGRFTYICPNVTDLFGHERAAVHELGTIDALLGEAPVDPEGLAPGETVEGIETTVTRADGAERTLTVTARRVSIGGGTMLYSLRDVTDRVERRREHEAIFNHTYQFTGLMAPDGTMRRANDTALAFGGLDREDVVGRRMWDAGWFPDDEATRERLRELVDRAAAGELVRTEVEVHGPERIAPTDFSIKPVFDEDGEVVLLVPEARDITELKRRERELERQKERLEEFASVVSHDLRNPLTVAQVGLELARESQAPADFDRVDAAHRRIDALVEDLLTLARERRCVEDPSPVQLDAVATTAWENVPAEGASLRVEFDDDRLAADPSRLQQLFENLLGNAVDHAGPAVTITVGPLSDADGFYVADDGPGVPVDSRETVFEKGYSTADGNTGFGLAIVRSIAEAHGWTVSVTESAAGGARFEVVVDRVAVAPTRT